MKRLNHEYPHDHYASLSGCICIFRRATGWVLPYGDAVVLLSRKNRLPVILAGDIFRQEAGLQNVLSIQPTPFRFQIGNRLGIVDPVSAQTLVSSDVSCPTNRIIVTDFVKSISLTHNVEAILGVYEKTDKSHP